MSKSIYTVARLGILSLLLAACGAKIEGGMISKPGIYHSSSPENHRTGYVYRVDEPFPHTVLDAVIIRTGEDCTIFDSEEYGMMVCGER